MGQFSAELNYERRLERYEKEWEKRILKSENWEEELERYLKEAMEKWGEVEEQGEEPGVRTNEEYEGFSLMMEGNLSEDEKQKVEGYIKEGEHREEEREVVTVTSGGLVFLHRPGREKEGVETVETEGHLRELIEAIETLAEEGSLQREERLEALAEELSKEEKRQEELAREELFEATARKIVEEAEAEGPLERLFEGVAEPEEVEERVEKLSKEFVGHERPEEEYEEPARGLEEGFVEYEEPIEEYDVLEEEFEELMEGEKSLEEVIEEVEKEVEEIEEPIEELVEKGVEEVVEEEVEKPVEGLVEERAEELSKEASEEAKVEEVSEEVVEGTEEEVGEEAAEEAEELVEEGISEERVEELSEEEVKEGAEELVEEEVGEVEREEEALSSESGEIVVGELDKTIPGSGYVKCRGKFEEGMYLIRVLRKDDGEVFEWSTRKEKADEALDINVPEEFRDELAGKESKITVVKYYYSLHFKCRGSNFYFSPREGLIVDGREIELESVKPLTWSERHRASMVAKLAQRNIAGGEVYLVLYEDGEVSFAYGGALDKEYYRKATLKVEGDLLIIRHTDGETTVPIVCTPSSEELSDEEVEKIKSVKEEKLGHIGRDKVAALALGGKFAEIKNVKSVHREVYIRDENGKEVGRLDLVFETEDGHLIIVEVKTTRNPNYTLKYLNQALNQSRGYRKLIEKYGLNVGGVKKGPGDVEAYRAFSVYFDLENKVVKVIHEALPKD